MTNDDGGTLDRVLEAARELIEAKSQGDLYRRAVELGRESLDLDRMGLFLYDAASGEMIGTWGTDSEGRLVDESNFRRPIPCEESFIAESLKRKDYLAVWEDRELTYRGSKVGRGWNAMAVLRDKDAVIGWLAADNLLTGRPLEGAGRGRLVLYAQIVSNLIAHMRYAESLESGIAARTAELRSRAKSLSELYEKADAQNSLKERLFTIIAHDLRGPIGAIRSLLATIAKDSGSFSDQELRSYVPEMLKSVDSVYGLLDNLLAWVRSQMDEIKVLRERIDLEALFEGVIATQRATAGAKGVGISMAVPRGSHVFSDRRIAEAILRNFLSNAIKFTPAGKEVSLRARQSREVMATYIEVSDEGRGMDERTLALLFTMDDDKKRVGTAGERGNGIGLVFCRDLAERLGGRIEAKSRPGLGSSFTLVLPDVFEDELPVLG